MLFRSGDIVKVLRQPAVNKRLVELGNEVVAGSPEKLAAHIDGELALYAKIIKTAGIAAR